MADGRIQDELTKLRLKMLQQKMRSQSSGNVEGQRIDFYDQPAMTSSTAGFHQQLQAETLKSKQLLQRVKEEREKQLQKPSIQTQNDDYMKDMMASMMSQNVQLQQLLLQQMVLQPGKSINTEGTQQQSLSVVKPVEIEQIGQREMSPFTTHATNRNHQRAAPEPVANHLQVPAQRNPAQRNPAQRNPSSKAVVPRGVATPVRPTERLPETPMKPRLSLRPEGFLSNQVHWNEEQPYPFPGSSRVRKLRHVGYVAWACFILIALLKQAHQRQLSATENLNSLIKQAIDELHREYYLSHDWSMYSTIQDAITDEAFDFYIKNPGVFQRLSKDSQSAFKELSSMVETIIHNVIQIKPDTGILSASREGVLWLMTQEGVFLPPNYLWQVEKDSMMFTDQGALTKVTNEVITMLLLGLFISRGLVSTLLFKPTEYGLMDNTPSGLAQSNLKVLGTILMKIVRDVSLKNSRKVMPVASEISSQLFSDVEMKYIYKKLEESLIWCKANLKRWTETYISSINTR